MTIKPCPFCDQPFSLEKLKDHIGAVHLGLQELPKISDNVEKPIMENENEQNLASINEKEGSTNQNIVITDQLHEKHQFSCDICDKTFASIQVLKAHKQISHKSQKIEKLKPKSNKNSTTKTEENIDSISQSQNKRIQRGRKCYTICFSKSLHSKNFGGL